MSEGEEGMAFMDIVFKGEGPLGTGPDREEVLK